MKEHQVKQMYDKGIELRYVPMMTGITVDQYLDQVRALHDPIVRDLFAERVRQNGLHPDFPESLRMAILTEEVGEVAKEILENRDKDALRDELIQVAAVCLRWIERL